MQKYICIPITFINPLKACFSNKKYILYVKSEKNFATKIFKTRGENKVGKQQQQKDSNLNLMSAATIRFCRNNHT